MRICFFGSFTAGGTERATFMVANELAKYNEVFILNASDRAPTFVLDGIKMEYLKKGSLFVRNMMLLKYLTKNRIDILISVEAMIGILSVIPAKFSCCKHIIWEHANYYQDQGSRHIKYIRQIELLLADGYVVLTKRDYNNFISNFKVRTQLIQIYNIADSKCACDYNLDSKTIISVGHIREIKNFGIIPEVGKQIFALHPDWCWKIYGRADGDVYERIQKKINDYKLDNNIMFVGRNNDMMPEYKAASIYVMTSLMEGLPMVLLEAKSVGLPIVSFDIETGPDEIIRNGVNGYLIAPYDIELMANCICKLIENKELRKDFSDNAELDLDKFDVERVISKWEYFLNVVQQS